MSHEQQNMIEQSGFQPVGSPDTAFQNPWFTVIRQPMNFVDRTSGTIKRSAEEGGVMNYVEMKPGVLIVADMAIAGTQKGTLLVPQERYTTNIVEGKPVMHYELPGGGIDEGDTESDIQTAAERELAEEAGIIADDYIILGNRKRGLMPHPSLTDHNFTVLARGARYTDAGTAHETNEILGQPEEFTWEQTEDMFVSPDGLDTTEGLKVISSAPTVSSLSLARAWLRRNDALGPKHFS